MMTKNDYKDNKDSDGRRCRVGTRGGNVGLFDHVIARVRAGGDKHDVHDIRI